MVTEQEDIEEVIPGTMGAFSVGQTAELNKRLDRRLIKQLDGKSYIEGYTVINTLNRIFGYGRWSRRVLSVEKETDENGSIIYWARVSLEVHAPDGTTSYHEDDGASVAPKGKTSGMVSLQSRDTAHKGAITDALKRAARSFGEQYANNLYDKAYMQERDQEEREESKARTQAAAQKNSQAVILAAMKKLEAEKVSDSEKQGVREKFFGPNAPANIAREETWTDEEVVSYGRYLRGL